MAVCWGNGRRWVVTIYIYSAEMYENISDDCFITTMKGHITAECRVDVSFFCAFKINEPSANDSKNKTDIVVQ